MLSRAKKWFSVRQGDGFLSYRATRSVMDLLIAEMIHRMEYDDKTKEPSPCLIIYCLSETVVSEQNPLVLCSYLCPDT